MQKEGGSACVPVHVDLETFLSRAATYDVSSQQRKEKTLARGHKVR